MDIWAQYGLFLLQALTVLCVVLVIVIALGRQSQGDDGKGRLVITNLSARLDAQRDQLKEAVQRASTRPRSLWGQLKSGCRRGEKPKPTMESREGVVYVLDFKGDIQASRADALKQEITTILSLETKPVEVVIRLESPGGLVHRYGFAASELARLEAAEIPTTVCVDTVAASGGYMMAVCARQIIASPFAVLGSIGVVAQVPNVHRFLKRHEIDVELHTAGSHKRTLTVLGENTPEGRRKFRDDLANTHRLFKAWIHEKRPQLDVESVADGSIFYGQDALAKGLIDRISPSDDIIRECSRRHTVLHLAWVQRKSLAKRLTGDVLSEVSARAESWLMKRSEDFTRL
ncbi:MAG: protease SohB [Litorivicinaceae bacterium]